MSCDFCRIGLIEFFSLISDEERLIKFLGFHKALPIFNVLCPQCQGLCNFSRATMTMRCENRKKLISSVEEGDGEEGFRGGARRGPICNFRRNIRKGTWFDKSNLPLDKILHVVFVWLALPSPRIKLLKSETGLKKSVIVEWFAHCREVCYQWALSVCERIGGNGVEVELGEADIRCSSERKVSGNGIGTPGAVAGMEVSTGRCFLVQVDSLGPEALLSVLSDWVEPDSTIVSDCWARYSTSRASLTKGSFSRLSLTYVDPGVDSGGVMTGRRSVGQLAEFLFKRRYPDHSERLHHFSVALGSLHASSWGG